MASKFLFFMAICLMLTPLASIESSTIKTRGIFEKPVYNIDTQLSYDKIQDAINANETLDGHTIILDSQVFYEHVIVNKSIWLFGLVFLGHPEWKPIIDGQGTGTVVTVKADNVTLSDLTIRNGAEGLLVDQVGNLEIRGFYDLLVSDNSGRGVYLNNSRNCTLSNLNITRNRYNFGVEGYSPEHFIHSVSNSIIDGKPIYYLMNEHDKQVVRDASYVAAVNCTNILFKNLNLSRNLQGLLLAYTSNSTVKNVNVEDNLWGIHAQNSTGNRIFHNNFVNNSVQVLSNASANFWDDGYPSGGNYWSDYAGSDDCSGPYQNQTGSDGIGDTPYPIDLNNIDHYPSMNKWSFLPVHNLDTKKDYGTIQEAISAQETESGHTLLVETGIYLEDLVVDKALTLVGESVNDTHITGSFGCRIDLKASGVRVEGFTVGGDSGLFLRLPGNATIRNNRILCSSCGIILRQSTNNVISDNIIEGPEGSVGLSFDAECSNNTVENNSISAGTGIVLGVDCDNNLIARNNITNNRFGLYLLYTSNNTIVENTLEKNYNGVCVQGATNNLIYHNNFIGNTLQVNGSFSANSWDDGLEGNYWSDYSGQDANFDGIGDTPYGTDGDRYPLMGTFHNFNASQESLVSVISNSTITDFQFFQSNSTVRMHVSNSSATQTFGFCRVSIPKSLMAPPYTVIINDGTAQVLHFNDTLHDNGTRRWVYFAYEHSSLKIDILPEFSSFAVLLLFIALMSAFLGWKKRPCFSRLARS